LKDKSGSVDQEISLFHGTKGFAMVLIRAPPLDLILSHEVNFLLAVEYITSGEALLFQELTKSRDWSIYIVFHLNYAQSQITTLLNLFLWPLL
jgi:hypothetical protein